MITVSWGSFLWNHTFVEWTRKMNPTTGEEKLFLSNHDALAYYMTRIGLLA